MKRCFEMETKKVVEKFLETFESEVDWELVGEFGKELDRLKKENTICQMMIFEASEQEDEEFGMVLVETGFDEYEWKVLYMAGNNGMIRLIIG